MTTTSDHPILVDPRRGSKHLLRPLENQGLPVDKTFMPYGDIAFEGRGKGGVPVSVGIELKRMRDLIGSLRTGRLSGHQLRGMLPTYDDRWLLVEGKLRTNSQGIVTGWKGAVPGNMSASELVKKILTLQYLGGLWIWISENQRESVQFITSLYHWWTDVDLDKHKSHLKEHEPPDPRLWAQSSTIRDMAKQIEGIGPTKATAVAKHFLTPQLMTNATVEEWMKIEGIDRTIATQAVHACQKRER